MKRATGNPVLVTPAGVRQLGDALGRHGERWLQELIHRHPGCLPVGDIEPGFGEPVAVCMELPTAHGPIDNLLVTPEGNLILVETKLWRNPQARREAVAQALDYATCLFEMSYEELEAAIRQGQGIDGPAPESLYGLVDAADRALPEPAFVDAVVRNLGRGRILVLVVGDGIRGETERLADMLQSHAGFHFTFALVELGVFDGVGEDGFVVVPRTLLQTRMVDRGVVTIDDRRATVTAAIPAVEGKPSSRRQPSITAEQFREAMARLHPDLPAALDRLLDRLAPYGVHAEYRRTLILRWEPPEGKPVNLGHIYLWGDLALEMVHNTLPRTVSQPYVERVAAALGTNVSHPDNGWWNLAVDGKPPKIHTLMDRFDAWAEVIEQFVGELRERQS